MNKELADFINEHISIELDVEKLLEKPKHESHGDFSFPCFLLAKELKQNPIQASQELSKSLQDSIPNFLEKIVATGPFINFYLNAQKEAKEILENINSYLTYKSKETQKFVIEWPSPNTNKSLHIGHTRNMLLGNALCNTLERVGNQVIKTSINNDRGIAICYAMLMYQEFFSNETPKSLGIKSDEFVANCYVEFKKACQKYPEKEYEKQAQEMLLKWEMGDKKVRELWKKIISWVYEGYEKTFENYKMPKFDKIYHESDIFDKGKEIVLDAINNNIKAFKKSDDGAIYVDLEEEGYGTKYLLRGDGTTLYMTQDLHLADLKEKEFNADKYIFVVGQEQEYHFKVLFELLGRLEIASVEKNLHFAYGYVYNEDGKKFSSRLGNTIAADEVYDKIVEKALSNLKEKELTKDLSKEELERRSKIIGFGALAFTFLKQNPMNSMNFSFDQALSFEGETGPYCQYTYARIQSLKRKVKIEEKELNYDTYNEREIQLLKILKEYPQVLEEASQKYKISAIAHYALKLSQAFNDFYQNSSILKAESQELQQARIHLAHNVGLILKDSLNCLNIETLDEM